MPTGTPLSLLSVAGLAILQGVAEFLPISSSGHLVLAHRVFNLQTGEGGAKTLIVLLNGGEETLDVEIPEGAYTILAFDGEAKADGSLGDYAGTHISVEPYSATILME